MSTPHPEEVRKWVESWEELGLGVPCKEAQADGVPCFDLGRECSECEYAYESYLEWLEKRPSLP